MARRKQSDRSDATTADLVAAARALFGRDGYAHVSLEEVAAAAGVTKGAVYHHFDGKPSLFAAVYAKVQQELTGTLRAAAQEATGWEAVRRGAHAFLRACLDPGVRRIVVIDAPAVLGRDEVRRIEDEYVGALLVAGLHRLDNTGRHDVGLRSRLILGALCEAALALARSTQPEQEFATVSAEVDILLKAYS